MSTFAKATYNVLAYSLTRPTYSNELFDYIFSFHCQLPTAKWDRAVDLGCGTGAHLSFAKISIVLTPCSGQATVHLRPFRQVVGIDPSMSMLENARAYVNEHETSSNIHPSYKFLQASAEDLRTALPDDSVDLLVAGTYLVLI